MIFASVNWIFETINFAVWSRKVLTFHLILHPLVFNVILKKENHHQNSMLMYYTNANDESFHAQDLCVPGCG